MGCINHEPENNNDNGQAILLPICNRRVTICGTINLPQGFRLTDQGNLHFATNACLECRTEYFDFECSTGPIDTCFPTPSIFQGKALRAVGSFNYVISVPVASACPTSFSYVSLENSACINQVVCLQNSSFSCNQDLAKCDIVLIFLGVRQVTATGCTTPTRLEVTAIYDLFRNVCPSPVVEPLSLNHGDFDRVYSE